MNMCNAVQHTCYKYSLKLRNVMFCVSRVITEAVVCGVDLLDGPEVSVWYFFKTVKLLREAYGLH